MPTRTTDRFKTAVTFDMPGATWEYVNALHSQYRFHENWPYGMLCHITGEVDSGIRSVGLWLDRQIEQEYFRSIAVEVITDSIHHIGPPPTDPAAGNFEPRATGVSRVVMTDACDAFADIGVDADGSAIHALGTVPVIVSVGGDAMQLGQSASLDSSNHAPEGLILAWKAEDGIEHQVWASEQQARNSLPAQGREPEILPLKRISFDSGELRA